MKKKNSKKVRDYSYLNTPEVIAKRTASLMGHITSDETKQKISATLSGRLRTGYKDMPGALYGKILVSSKLINKVRRHLQFNLTKHYCWKLMQIQQYKCAISGVELNWKIASLDRIDSSIGYVKGNVQWVHKKMNLMKHTMTMSDFIKWCNLIVEYHKQN